MQNTTPDIGMNPETLLITEPRPDQNDRPKTTLLRVHGGRGPIPSGPRTLYPGDAMNLRVSAKLHSATPAALPAGLAMDLVCALQQSPNETVHMQVRTSISLPMI